MFLIQNGGQNEVHSHHNVFFYSKDTKTIKIFKFINVKWLCGYLPPLNSLSDEVEMSMM